MRKITFVQFVFVPLVFRVGQQIEEEFVILAQNSIQFRDRAFDLFVSPLKVLLALIQSQQILVFGILAFQYRRQRPRVHILQQRGNVFLSAEDARVQLPHEIHQFVDVTRYFCFNENAIISEMIACKSTI